VSSVNLAVLRESSLVLWQARKPRERKTLGLGAALAIVALLYALVIAPAIEARQQLERTLPSLRQQASELKALAKEGAQFAAAGATPAPVPTRQTIESSLRDKGLKAQSIVVDRGLTRLQLTAVPFSSLLDWLNDAQRTARLAVVDASIVAQPAADTVNATITLQQKSGTE
jgi:general secretion pathway protein M